MAILKASHQLPDVDTDGREFLGELSLTGAVRPVKGVLPAAMRLDQTRRELIVPEANRSEVSISGQRNIRLVRSLEQLVAYLTGSIQLDEPSEPPPATKSGCSASIRAIRGQVQAKRALAIAASGRHNLGDDRTTWYRQNHAGNRSGGSSTCHVGSGSTRSCDGRFRLGSPF